MSAQTDEFDIKLVNALIEEGRATNRDLAKKIGLSESACSVRRQRLEREGVILSYSAIVAYERLTAAFRAWLSIVLVRPEVSATFEAIASAEPSVTALYAVGGDADFMLEIMTANYDEARVLYERLVSQKDLVAAARIRPIYKQGARRRPAESSGNE